jgi:hypothetical protein
MLRRIKVLTAIPAMRRAEFPAAGLPKAHFTS